MSTVLLWLGWAVIYIAIAVLVAALYARVRFVYRRRQIRRLKARANQVAADVAEARTFRDLRECEAIWTLTITIPHQRRQED